MNQFIETPNSHRQVIQKPYIADPEEVKHDSFKGGNDLIAQTSQLKEVDLKEIVSMMSKLPPSKTQTASTAQQQA